MKNIPLPDLYYLENPDLKQLFRIMRISIFLLFFCLFSLMAENSHSQNARVTINRSDAPLESILNEIESQTDYLFIYKEDVNVKMRKTIQVNGKPVSEVLPILLTGSSIGYKMEGNHIILTRDVALAAQQQGVTGVVTDVLGEPLIGVTVMLKGDMQGTVTDINGRFSLSAEQGDVIVVSYIGYASQEIRLKDTKLLRIMMKEDVELLDEVVVIGYGSISKKELTSAVSHISGKDMLQIGSGNPAMQIQGKVSGLAVENSTPSDPNSSPSIQVRGVSSRSAGLGPLIVIDGIPGGSLDNLNENDIARFSEVKYQFPGVNIETQMTRYYPHGELFAHVIGYVGRINDKELKSIDKDAYAGTNLIGKIGVEKSYEDLLHGTPGYESVEADAHSNILRHLGRKDPTRGNDLYLSLDYGLQVVASQQLAGRRGAKTQPHHHAHAQ